jgi:hypothetical protein
LVSISSGAKVKPPEAHSGDFYLFNMPFRLFNDFLPGRLQ